MKHKIIAVDIDGTLLNSKSQLTERTINAVKKYAEMGGYFVLSTGRPFQGIKKLVDELGLHTMPYITYNGAMVMIGGETVYSLTMQPEYAKIVVDEGHKRNSTMICWSNNQLYSEFIDEKVIFYQNISKVEPVVLKSLSDVASNGITKIVWYDDKESTAKYHQEMKEVIGDKVNVHPSRVDFLEFVNKECSKATALQIVADKLGVDVKDTVAIGDGFNDLPMLTYAGLGVAMGNADEKVKEKCCYVTDTCDNDGVAKFIEENVL